MVSRQVTELLCSLVSNWTESAVLDRADSCSLRRYMQFHIGMSVEGIRSRPSRGLQERGIFLPGKLGIRLCISILRQGALGYLLIQLLHRACSS